LRSNLVRQWSGRHVFIIIARKETRQQFASIPALIKTRKIPLWNWFAGLCGAMVVFSEGASASALGVATFQTALISALLLSGLLCDRFGVGVDEKKYFTPWRVTGALFAVIATIFVVSPQWHSTSFILLAILPFWQDYSLAGSPLEMPKLPRQRALCWFPLPGTSSSAFVCWALRWRYVSH
jgi:transporter family-2 protein